MMETEQEIHLIIRKRERRLRLGWLIFAIVVGLMFGVWRCDSAVGRAEVQPSAPPMSCDAFRPELITTAVGAATAPVVHTYSGDDYAGFYCLFTGSAERSLRLEIIHFGRGDGQPPRINAYHNIPFGYYCPERELGDGGKLVVRSKDGVMTGHTWVVSGAYLVDVTYESRGEDGEWVLGVARTVAAEAVAVL